jgi:signal transduction histidine kinase/ligand-binding sensor domain-containing protein
MQARPDTIFHVARVRIHWKAYALRLSLVVLCLLLLCPVAAAGDLPWSLGRYQHTAWTSKDGAPPSISSLAQTADGLLWIGGGAGLYSFDGQRFRAFEPAAGEALLSSQILSLHVSGDGSLWIGYETGGVSQLRHGHLIHYDEHNGFSGGGITYIVETRDGAIWVTSTTGLMRLSGGQWTLVAQDKGLDGATPRGAFVAADGTLWVATDGGIYSLREHATNFVSADTRVERIIGIVPTPDGLAAQQVNGPNLLFAFAGNGLARKPVVLPTFGFPLFDRRGGLWLADAGNGIRYLADQATWLNHSSVPWQRVAQNFGVAQGLSGNYVWPVLEDRQGNIWFGTQEGLDRFRAVDLARAQMPNGMYGFGLAPGANGSVWAGSSNRPVVHITDAGIEEVDVPAFTFALYREPTDGTIWAAGRRGLWHIGAGRPIHVSDLPDAHHNSVPLAITRDTLGRLWVGMSSEKAGLYVVSDGRWQLYPLQGRAGALATDRAGAIWAGYRDNRIAIIGAGGARMLLAADGVNIGNIRTFQESRRGMWVGGSNGLGYVRDGHFRKVRFDGPVPVRDITATIFARDGSLWLHTLAGIMRIPAEAIERAEDDPAAALTYRLFDVSDGLQGLASQEVPLPSGIAGTDGRLWFSTSSGLFWIDSDHLSPVGDVPPVRIDGMLADGTFHAGADASLSKSVHAARFDFSAVTLSAPEHTRFRARLEPVDRDWRDLGNRRDINYNDLGPGTYTFRVQARTINASWDASGPSYRFFVTPAFYQTTWFRLLCGILAASLLVLAHKVRIARLATRDSARFNERLWERERIARELHDTLLQDVQAMVLHLHAIDQRFGAENPAQEDLRSMNGLAQGTLIAARESVQLLREGQPSCDDLVHGLRDVIEQLGRHYPVTCSLEVQGTQRKLDGFACSEILAIGREAILNGLRHAQAASIHVMVSYERSNIVLTVRDDGVGIDASLLDAGQKPGHWGLLGMRERAEKIRATLRIELRRAGGTDVVLRIPSKNAYRRV